MYYYIITNSNSLTVSAQGHGLLEQMKTVIYPGVNSIK